MVERRLPFSVRIGAVPHRDDDGPFAGVPPHLDRPLREWVKKALMSPGRADLIAIRLRITIPPRHNGVAFLAAREGWELLDVVEQLLVLGITPDDRIALRRLLDEGGSLYRIDDAGIALEQRVMPAVREALQQTIADAASADGTGSAADHLAAAWRAAYGREPKPMDAYSEAIKAVEAAAHAVIEPNNKKPTQGSMVKVLANSRHKFLFELPGGAATEDEARDGRMTSVAVVEEMWRMLNRGQTARHGSQEPTVEETLEAARAAVHLAATLVQWFTSGALRRIS